MSWLEPKKQAQKNLKKFVDLTTRVSLVQNLLTTKELPASVGARQMSAQLKLRGYHVDRVIDWYSRCIVGWEVDDTLDTRMVINALKKAFKVAKPRILNSDQACQFTSQQYMEFIKENGIRQSMDGKSRWADNIMIKR